MKHGENMSGEKHHLRGRRRTNLIDGSLRFGQPVRMGEDEEVPFWYLDHQFSEWVVSV